MNRLIRRFLLIGIITVISIGSSTHAFEPDNNLLNKLYTKIDNVYENNPTKLLNAYHKMSYAKLLVATKPETTYYLNKLEQYMRDKLFVFNEQPNFACLKNYVQKGDTIEIDYTIKNQADGALITTTLADIAREAGAPVENRLAFAAGMGKVLSGMDQLVIGAPLHTTVADVIAPKYAYGTYSEEKIVTFTNKLPAEVQASDLGGSVMMPVTVDDETYLLVGKVIAKTETSATVDFNHIHAGKTILLSLAVMNLFKACSQ